MVSAISTNLSEIDEVYPRIYMSGYGPAKDWITIKSLAITHILTVTPYANPLFKEEGVKYLIFDEISDNGAQQILQYFERSNEFIRNALAENETNKVLVHCAAGISRSGAFCCAYMIQEGKMTLKAALEYGKARRTNF